MKDQKKCELCKRPPVYAKAKCWRCYKREWNREWARKDRERKRALRKEKNIP